MRRLLNMVGINAEMAVDVDQIAAQAKGFHPKRCHRMAAHRAHPGHSRRMAVDDGNQTRIIGQRFEQILHMRHRAVIGAVQARALKTLPIIL